MNKESSILDTFANRTPAELFALSALIGGTGYGATRSISSILSNLRNKPKVDSQTLDIPVVSNTNSEKTSSVLEGAMQDLGKAGLGVAGLGAGWMGARSIYNALKQRQIDAEAKKQEEERNNILMALSKQGSEIDHSKYPNTMAFCVGITKIANGPSIGEVLQHGVSKAIPAVTNAVDTASGGMAHHLLASLLAMGLISAGGTYMASKSMRDKNDSQNKIPTHIRVVNIPGKREQSQIDPQVQPQLV